MTDHTEKHNDYAGIKREFDVRVIESILKHPAIFYNATDVGCKTPEDLKLNINAFEYYSISTHSHANVGLFCMNYLNSTTCMLHVSFLPCARGQVARMAAVDMLAYLAKKGLLVATAFIPSKLAPVHRYVTELGFIQVGVIAAGVIRDDKPDDLLIYSRGL